MAISRFILLFLSLSAVSFSAFAQECTAKSGVKTVPLLELYTTEGCSSCPPADQWLSKLNTNQPKVTPLAFHVDYWNYIGWSDPFSKAEYADRQRKQAAFDFSPLVYTPQFTLNGQDFRGWQNGKFAKAANAVAQEIAPVSLTLNATPQASGELQIQAGVRVNAGAENAKLHQYLTAYIAVYENGLKNQVNAGENNGRELKHDYVVRDFYGAFKLDNKAQLNQALMLKSSWKNRQAGVVLFVQDSRTGKVLQSLQLPFCS